MVSGYIILKIATFGGNTFSKPSSLLGIYLYCYFLGVYDSRPFVWVTFLGDVSNQELP